jgi:hypothetical protein
LPRHNRRTARRMTTAGCPPGHPGSGRHNRCAPAMTTCRRPGTPPPPSGTAAGPPRCQPRTSPARCTGHPDEGAARPARRRQERQRAGSRRWHTEVIFSTPAARTSKMTRRQMHSRRLRPATQTHPPGQLTPQAITFCDPITRSAPEPARRITMPPGLATRSERFRRCHPPSSTKAMGPRRSETSGPAPGYRSCSVGAVAG